MIPANAEPQLLRTSAGQYPLHEYHLILAERRWTILHTGLVLTYEDEQRYLREQLTHLPYGVALWPSAIAMAHELAHRGDELRGKTVLELGAGTGLPGLIAASLGARVVQTDRQELAMAVCRRNGELNGVEHVAHALVDWTEWQHDVRYDRIIGSDILYSERLLPFLAAIFSKNLAPGGRVLIADPLRAPSLRFLESLQEQGWSITLNKWNLGDEREPRPFGVFELAVRQD
jgi:predicted nicotinamide N-methyase